MNRESAVIIIDTGFELGSILKVTKLLGVYDLPANRAVVGTPYISRERNWDDLVRFARDPMRHGTLVLENLLAADSTLPVILIRAYGDEGKLLRSEWSGGFVSREGRTEALKWAIDLCKRRGLTSVTNCSFGGYTHAMDGTGWEAHCISQLTGDENPGHVVVAGAGAGVASPIRATFEVGVGECVDVQAEQNERSVYNFWCNRIVSPPGTANASKDEEWILEVYRNGDLLKRYLSTDIVPNLWNGRRQVTFSVDGPGSISLKVSRFWESRETPENESEGITIGGVASLVPERLSFDCWIDHQSAGSFLNHVNFDLVAEPAVFHDVVAVGLEGGVYSPSQEEEGCKPDSLLAGSGPISFRLPSVVARIAGWLRDDPLLTVSEVKEKLGKHPEF